MDWWALAVILGIVLGSVVAAFIAGYTSRGAAADARRDQLQDELDDRQGIIDQLRAKVRELTSDIERLSVAVHKRLDGAEERAEAAAAVGAVHDRLRGVLALFPADATRAEGDSPPTLARESAPEAHA